jgi:hypothetical protein
MGYDVFICHASEDKEEIALPLARELEKQGLTVWIDTFRIRLGESISKAIDNGLAKSRYGLVVLSHDFFKKYWTGSEIGGIKSIESKGEMKLLPILHNITIDEVRKYSPTLADRNAKSSDKGLSVMVAAILTAMDKKGSATPEAQAPTAYFIPEMSLLEIANTLKTSDKKNLLRLGDHVHKFLTISNTDAEMAVIKADSIVKTILREVCLLTDGYAESLGVSDYDFLRSKGILGSIVEKHCSIIESFRIIAFENEDHFNESSALTKNEVALCRQSLKIVINWYINTYPSNKIFHSNKLEPIPICGFTSDDLSEMYKLETKFFPLEIISPVEISAQWYQKNPQSYIGLRDKLSEKLIAFFVAIPVTETMFNEIESGNFNDAYLSAESIREYNLPDFYKLYLCSFCVDPAYNQSNAFKLIIDGFIDLLLDLALQKEIFITEMIADAVTKKGEELCEFAGMKEITVSSHGSKIYKAVLLPPSLRMKYKNGKRLTDFYKRIYEEYKELL